MFSSRRRKPTRLFLIRQAKFFEQRRDQLRRWQVANFGNAGAGPKREVLWIASLRGGGSHGTSKGVLDREWQNQLLSLGNEVNETVANSARSTAGKRPRNHSIFT